MRSLNSFQRPFLLEIYGSERQTESDGNCYMELQLPKAYWHMEREEQNNE
jgi:hypothetical protein